MSSNADADNPWALDRSLEDWRACSSRLENGLEEALQEFNVLINGALERSPSEAIKQTFGAVQRVLMSDRNRRYGSDNPMARDRVARAIERRCLQVGFVPVCVDREGNPSISPAEEDWAPRVHVPVGVMLT